MVYQSEITFNTSGHKDSRDLTDELRQAVGQSGIRQGIAHIFNIGSTAAIGTIEFEPGLREDLPAILDRLIPAGKHYGHEQAWHDGNAHSHLQATIVGPSLTVPIRNGRLVLGTWQQVFHLECDNKPRQRTLQITLYGEDTEA